MNKATKSLLLVAAAIMLATISAYAEPDAATRAVFKNLMAATVANDYEGFVAECDATMKAALTRPQLEGVSKLIGPRAKQGYDADYLGELNQHGFRVNLWRLRFADNGDDILATLSMKDGKAGGFYLK